MMLHMGNPNGFRGHQHSAETKAKISAAKRGHTLTPEHRAKIGAASRGRQYPNRKLTDEHKAKLSAALQGRPKSEAHKAAAAAAIRQSPAFWQAQKLASAKAHSARKGQPISAEHKQRISAANKGVSRYIADAATRLKMSGSQRDSPRCIAKRAQIACRNPSGIEHAVAAVLTALGIAFERQQPIGRYVVDLFVEHRRLVIECDGSYWHRNTQARDAARDAYLAALGYRVLRLPEPDIRSGRAAHTLKEVFASSA